MPEAPPFLDQLVDWRTFERFVHDLFSEDPNLVVQHDVTLEGKSGAPRQIDVVFTQTIKGLAYVTLVECKRWKEKVTRQRIDVLASAVEDLNAAKGVMFTTSGYEAGAEKYAKHKGIELFTVRDLTDEEWGLPGRVVWFHMHFYTAQIVPQPGQMTVASIVDQPPSQLDLELPISPESMQDPAFTLYSIVDGSPGPNLITLLVEARRRVLERLSAGVSLIGGGDEAERVFSIPVEIDLADFETRQLLRPFGGLRFDTVVLTLVAHVHQSRFEHDRGQGLNFALAVENYVTRHRQVVARPKGDGVTRVYELDDQAETRVEDAVENGMLLRIFTEPWVRLPETEAQPEPCMKFDFKLPSWDLSLSVPPGFQRATEATASAHSSSVPSDAPGPAMDDEISA